MIPKIMIVEGDIMREVTHKEAVLIVEKENQLNNLPLLDNEVKYLTNTYYHDHTPKDNFICKGKHQYRETKGEEKNGIIINIWKCQCGKTL